MSAIGYLQVRAFTSSAQLPLENVAITLTASEGTAIAMRVTDRSGLTRPIEIPVPDKSESQEPGADEKPYTSINLYAWKKGFERIQSDNIQIFAETTTYQNLEMVPLSELPGTWEHTVNYDTPPQNL